MPFSHLIGDAVREYSLPALAQIPATANLTDVIFRRAAEQPQAVVLRRPAGSSGWADVTASQFRAEVVAVAKGLIATGIEAGDRVALMSRTRYEWTLIDYAIWTAGAVTVPVYETSSAEQAGWILSDSGARACFVETASYGDIIGGLRDRVPALEHLWQIDPDPMGSSSGSSSGSSLDALRAAGACVADEVLAERAATARAAGLATIIYTSGTTGRPKGCELTHENLLCDVRNAFLGPLAVATTMENSGTLLFLPLAHSFAVLEGYGLTETTAAATVNRPDRNKIGTVGMPLPGVGIRIAEDGEILISGKNVFPGYWRNESATKEAFAWDGWFATGDVGELDEEGFLKITGRKKEMIVTAGGKNVAPAVLEDRLRSHALISQCMVVGDGKPFIAALITLDAEALGPWRERHGKPADATIAFLRDDPDLVAAVQAAVDDANLAVSRAESIRKFRILDSDFTQEAGQLTVKLGIRRSVIGKDFAADIEALYS